MKKKVKYIFLGMSITLVFIYIISSQVFIGFSGFQGLQNCVIAQPRNRPPFPVCGLTDEQYKIVQYVRSNYPNLRVSRPTAFTNHHNNSRAVDFIHGDKNPPLVMGAFRALSRNWPGGLSIGYGAADYHIHVDLKKKRRRFIEYDKKAKAVGRGKSWDWLVFSSMAGVHRKDNKRYRQHLLAATKSYGLDPKKKFNVRKLHKLSR